MILIKETLSLSVNVEYTINHKLTVFITFLCTYECRGERNEKLLRDKSRRKKLK